MRRGRPPASPPRSASRPSRVRGRGVPEVSRPEPRAHGRVQSARILQARPAAETLSGCARSSADQLRSRFRVSSGAPGPGRPEQASPLGPAHRPPGPPLRPPSLAPGPPAPFRARRGFARPRSGVRAEPARAGQRGEEGAARRCPGPRRPQRPFRPRGAPPPGAGTSGAGASGPSATVPAGVSCPLNS